MVAKIYFFHRPQSDRDPVRPLRAGIPLLWILPDDVDARATGVSRPGAAGDWQMAPAHFRVRHVSGSKYDDGFLLLDWRVVVADHVICQHDHDVLHRLGIF